MKKVYYVQKKHTREILNLAGGWSRSRTSYRLAYFDTEAAAQAVVPPNVECEVLSFLLREDNPEENDGCHFYLLGKGNKFLDTKDAWTALNHKDGAASFVSEDEALDKAVALGVDLDTVDVIRVRS